MKHSECELFLRGYEPAELDHIYRRVPQKLSGFRVIDREAELIVRILGVPASERGLSQVLASKAQEYELMFRRLGLFGSTVATYILQRVAGVPELIYLIRTSPTFVAADHLKRIDDLSATDFESILRTFLSEDTLTEISLSTSLAGIRLTRTSDVAIPAPASSCHAMLTEVREVLNSPEISVQTGMVVESFTAYHLPPGESPAAVHELRCGHHQARPRLAAWDGIVAAGDAEQKHRYIPHQRQLHSAGIRLGLHIAQPRECVRFQARNTVGPDVYIDFGCSQTDRALYKD